MFQKNYLLILLTIISGTVVKVVASDTENSIFTFDNETTNSTSDATTTTEESPSTTPDDVTSEPFNATSTTETSSTERPSEDPDKFFSPNNSVVLEHVDFVHLRFQHLLRNLSSNISALRHLQQEEFKVNPVYQNFWQNAAYDYYNGTKREMIQQTFANFSKILNAPDELHIALIAYSGSAYYEFNKDTRDLCSGLDVDRYKYKSYFKFLEMAIHTLGPEITEWANGTGESVLYRGVGLPFLLTVGQKLAFQTFISTTRNPNVAQGFSWGTRATVFEFRASPNHPLTHGVYLGVHSYFPGEQEVLLSPLQMFEVASVRLNTTAKLVHYVLTAREFPSSAEECALSAAESWSYAKKLKIAVAVLGAIVGTVGLVGFVYSFYLLSKKKCRFSWGKRRTESALQLT